MAAHPYGSMPDNRFWRRGLVGWSEGRYRDLFKPRFEITRETRISTAGSCFAQHIGRQLKTRGFNYQDFEPAPPALAPERRGAFGYEMFSCRYGNIYTSRQLLQLLLRASAKRQPELYWEQDGRFYDPYRPSIEPNGFGSAAELSAMREYHLTSVRRMFASTDVFVFTLGLTEVWLNRQDGTAYPTCPGTVAGEYDPALHVFHNLSFAEILADMEVSIGWMRKRLPDLKILLTVSPVPLAATASDQHVVTATTYSKSVLRAVAGELYRRYDFVDYFPSYEIVTAPASRGAHYGADMRNVTPEGVASVMACFFEAHGEAPDYVQQEAAAEAPSAADTAMIRQMGVICDEEKLDPVIVT